MEAKDTVLKIKWMSKETQTDQDNLLLKQAEISFEAGLSQGMQLRWALAAERILLISPPL